MDFLKNGTNELIYKTETDVQIPKTNLWFPKRKYGGRDKSEVWDWQIQTAVYNITNSKVLLYTAQGTILRIL